MTKVKICGITQRSDLEQIIDLGIDYAGIIMVKDSPRYQDFQAVHQLLFKLDKKNTKIVAVLMNEDWKEAEKIIEMLPIDFVQFHGTETPDYCEAFHFPYIKVFSTDEFASIKNYSTDMILIDSSVKGKRGGTGQAFDWNLLKGLDLNGKKLFIAGGLNPDNVLDCISVLNPYAVDLSSGVEKEPGVKDISKIKKLIEKIK